jgi:multiple sugar transport system substrate-binding protein/sn-glycerol 3-phosphate transport system substrate-binding protein
MKLKPHKLALLLVLFGIFLSACQPIDVPEDPFAKTNTVQVTKIPATPLIPTATPTQTPVPDWFLPETALKDVKISFVHPWTGPAAKQIEILVDSFNQNNDWGIFAEAFAVGGAQQVFQQTEYALQVGEAPNVVIAPVDELAYWKQHEQLVSLDDYLQDATYGMPADQQAAFYPLFWAQDVVNGERLGIPVFRSGRVLVYNQTWANEMGYGSPPQTPLQLKNQTCAASDVILNDDVWQNNGVGGLIIDRHTYTALSWLVGFGIEEFPADESVYRFNQPQTIETFDYLRELSDDVCAWTSRNPTPYEYFANREALMYAAEVEEITAQQKAMQMAENDDHWSVIPFPAKSGEPALLVYGSSFGIIQNSPQQDLAAWLFIRWMNDPINQKLFAQKLDAFPVTTTLLDEFSTQRSSQWNAAVELLENAKPAPSGAWWRVGRFVLPDAVYQIYQPNFTPDSYGNLLKLLDETIESLSKQPAAAGW